MRYLFLIISMFSFSCNGYSLKEKFYSSILIIQTDHKDCEEAETSDFIIAYQDSLGNRFKITKIPCVYGVVDNFSYSLRYKNSYHDLLVFNKYSDPAGLSKIYLYDVTGNKMYTTDFFSLDNKIPLLTSVDENIKRMQFISLDVKDCGSVLNEPLSLLWELKGKNKDNLDGNIVSEIKIK